MPHGTVPSEKNFSVVFFFGGGKSKQMDQECHRQLPKSAVAAIYVAMFFSIPHAFPKRKKPKSFQSLVIWKSAFPGTAWAKTDIQVKLGQKHPLETSSFSMSLQFYGYILGNDSMLNRDITRFLSVENYSVGPPASCRGTSRRWRLSCASSWRPNPRWSSCNTPWDTMRMRSSRVQGRTWGWRLKIDWSLKPFETYGLGWNNVKFTTGVFCLFWGWTWWNMAKACYNNKKDTFCGSLFCIRSQWK